MSDLGSTVQAMYEQEKEIEIACDCSILSIRVVKADKLKGIYHGTITIVDYAEHAAKCEHEWIAKPLNYDANGKPFGIDITPTNPFWGSGFTLQPDVDEDMRHQIRHAIDAYTTKDR